jgi:hypothetical protein
MSITELEGLLKYLKDHPTGVLTAFLALVITIAYRYFSAFIKEKAKLHAKQTPHAADPNDNKTVSPSSNSQPVSAQQPIVFADGDGCAKVALVWRVVDPVKYTYEADDPKGIMLNRVEVRFRQIVEGRSSSDVRSERKAIETALLTELRPEFQKYGIELKSVDFGSIIVNGKK